MDTSNRLDAEARKRLRQEALALNKSKAKFVVRIFFFKCSKSSDSRNGLSARGSFKDDHLPRHDSPRNSRHTLKNFKTDVYNSNTIFNQQNFTRIMTTYHGTNILGVLGSHDLSVTILKHNHALRSLSAQVTPQ